MRVTVQKERLLIVPETDFEEDFLEMFSSISKENKAWLKHGASADHVVGLVIESVPSAPIKEEVK